MKYSLTLSRLLASLSAMALPMTAHAIDGAAISNIFLGVINAFFGSPLLWISVAVLVMVIAGLTMMLSQDEGVLQKARVTIGSVVIGSILVTIITVMQPAEFVRQVYNTNFGTIFLDNGEFIGLEATGVANWLATIAVVIGVLMVIVSALRAVLSFGDEGSYQNVRMAVLHLVIGMIVIGGAFVFQTVFFETHRPAALLALILVPLQILVGIMALIAVGIIVYAGFRMIISFGKEDEFTAARSLIIRAIIGLIVLLVSLTLIQAVLSCFDGSCTA